MDKNEENKENNWIIDANKERNESKEERKWGNREHNGKDSIYIGIKQEQ